MSSTTAHQAGLQAQQRCLAPARASGSHPAVASGTGHSLGQSGGSRECKLELINNSQIPDACLVTAREGSAGFDDSGIFMDNSAATNDHSEPLGFNHGTRDLMAVSDCSCECPAQEDFVACEPASYDIPPGFEAGADNRSDGFSYLDDTPGRQHSPADIPQPASPFVGDVREGSRSDGFWYMGDPPSRSPSPPPCFSDIEPEPQRPASPDIADPDVIDVAGDPLYADCLSALPETAGFEVPGLDKMARTLRTVERRLGVDPDRYTILHSTLFAIHVALTTIPMSYTPSPPLRAQNQNAQASSSVTKTQQTAAENESPRPGKLQQWNDWRGAEDGPGHLPPRPCEDWEGWENPRFCMFDIMDGWRWHAITAGLEWRRGGSWGVEDVDAHHIGQHFVALPDGLVLQINLDWFRTTKRGGYSVGAVYITICNNSRSVRFRREETILYCVIPGPGEPTTQQLNQILKPLHAELTRLYDGVLFRLPGEETEEPVTEAMHAYLSNISSDLPATHKLNGLRGHTSEHLMCDMCEAKFTSLTIPECFDSSRFQYRDDWRFLKYAHLWHDADEDDHVEIVNKRGVEWSLLDDLPDWLPGRDSPPNFMHAAYLGEAKHVIQGILGKGGMFTQRNRHNKPLEKLYAYLGAIRWPPGFARPLQAVTSGGGKADMWRNFATVLVPGLYAAWQVGGNIPDDDAPLPRSSTKAAKTRARLEELLNKRCRANVATANPEATTAEMEELAQLRMSRNYAQHFETSISVEEAQRAAECHERACQVWARMFCHLVPYFHILMHLWFWIFLLGPVYGWWVYPYEQNYGFLAKLRHNGHPGELEATMLRGWTKVMLLFELVQHLNDLDAKMSQDLASIKKLREMLKGETKGIGSQRRTLLAMIASMTADYDNATVQLFKHPRMVDLRTLGVYTLVYHFLKELWAEDVILLPDTAPTGLGGESFIANRIASHPLIHICGLRYGAASSAFGAKASYTYINGQQPVKIDHILHITHARDDRSLPLLTSTCAIVRPFMTDSTVPEMPWALQASDLGIGTWLDHRLGSPIFMDVKSFSGQFALAEVPHGLDKLWVTISLAHSAQEPDDDWPFEDCDDLI
ncbi:hypothetical protein NUW54_g789 [Trametes sanguinea]|uniref:Uncharacterized protein n=1 Tax=Trametes sanguinea TaxID=158606 RepID=A0ACC1Q9Y9_9APHY|nr:hypothetical protein NUW54_g789 [Trametes sanguinea]